MNLGALIDLGVDSEYIIQELKKLALDGEYQIHVRRTAKNGITGTKVDVILKSDASHHYGDSDSRDYEHDHSHSQNLGQNHNHSHEHHHSYNHDHEQGYNHSHNRDHRHDHIHNHDHNHSHDHEHSRDYTHAHQHVHSHIHRNLADIQAIINSSDLSEAVKQRSLSMFMKIAEAEAKVHGKSINEVHFHEVGAIDSIIDIVGAAIALEYLQIDKVISSSVQVGGGFVHCAHGKIPVPAPATVEILQGVPIKIGLVEFETTTPTGAAILAANVDQYTNRLDFVVEKIGYGLGTRDLKIPNVLRIYLGYTEENQLVTQQHLIETNIDDMNPECYGYLEQLLFDIGARDVYKTPIIMKKGRPAVMLSVLVEEQHRQQVIDLIFRHTTSIGVRQTVVEKTILVRQEQVIKTKYGKITVKIAFYHGKPYKYKAEYEDCKRAAEENGISIAVVYREVDMLMVREYNF